VVKSKIGGAEHGIIGDGGENSVVRTISTGSSSVAIEAAPVSVLDGESGALYTASIAPMRVIIIRMDRRIR
jgi:hypothetical protein